MRRSGNANSLSALFLAGADEPVVTGISSNTSGLPHLFSKGEAVLYSVSGGTLTAFVDGNANGTFEVTDRTVFTLTVNGNGSWSFDLEISSITWRAAATLASCCAPR